MKKNDGYLKSRDAVLNDIDEYAFAALPEKIAPKAVPEEKTIGRWYKSGKLAREKKRYPHERDITHQDSAGSALINPDWRYCGDRSFANIFLYVSLSKKNAMIIA